MTRFLTGLAAAALVGAVGIQSATVANAQGVPAQGAKQAQPLVMDSAVRMGTLPNGVKYYIRRNAWPEKRAELRLAINAGSILEDSSQRGLAHFLEHMAFNGTKNFPEHELIDYLESIGMGFGADINAYTSFDETVYKLTVPSDSGEFLSTGLKVLQDWAQAVTIDSAEVEKERGVIIEEWRQRRSVRARLQDKQLPLIFAGSRYADRLPIGSLDVIRTAPRSELVRFYNEWYRPDLMGVIVVGDINVDTIEAQIKELFSGIQARDPDARDRFTTALPGVKEPQMQVLTDPELTSQSVSVLFRGERQRTMTTADMRRNTIFSMYNSMLNNRLNEIRLKADAPFMGAKSGRQGLTRSANAYTLSATPKPGQMEQSVTSLLTEVKRVREFGFTASELERTKTNMLTGVRNSYERRNKIPSQNFADGYVQSFLSGQPNISMDDYKTMMESIIPSITLEQVHDVAKNVITDTNRVILAQLPSKDSASAPQPQALLAAVETGLSAPVTAYVENVSNAPLLDPLPTPGKIVSEAYDSATQVYTWKLSNGLKVLFKQTNFSPDRINLSGTRRGGFSLVDNDEYRAIAQAQGMVSSGGLDSLDVVALRKRLTGISAGYEVEINGYSEQVQASGTVKDFETGLQLLTLQLTKPRKDSSVVATLVKNVRTNVANRRANPASVFSDTVNQTLNQYNPRYPIPSVEDVDKYDLDKSMAFFKKTFADMGGFRFMVIGDVAPDSIKPLIERYIASLPVKDTTRSFVDRSFGRPDGVVKKSVYAGKEPKGQSSIIFHGDVPYSRQVSAELSAVRGVLDLRLIETLREKMGGTYSPSLRSGLGRIPRETYSLTIGFSVEPNRMEELQQAVFDEVQKFKAEGPTEEEMQKIKERSSRSFETALKNNGFWLGNVMFYDEMGWPFADILTANQYTQNLTAEQVKEAANRFLNESNYAMFSWYPAEMPEPAAKPAAAPAAQPETPQPATPASGN